MAGSMAGLVDAFDTKNAGDFFNVYEDGFELAFVGNFEIGVNARVGAVRAAFEIVNVTVGVAEYGGDVGQQAGAIFGTNYQMHQELGSTGSTPFDGDAAFGLI